MGCWPFVPISCVLFLFKKNFALVLTFWVRVFFPAYLRRTRHSMLGFLSFLTRQTVCPPSCLGSSQSPTYHVFFLSIHSPSSSYFVAPSSQDDPISNSTSQRSLLWRTVCVLSMARGT